MQKFYVVESTTNAQNDDCELLVRCEGAKFYLFWSPADLITAPKILEEYRQRLHQLSRGIDDDSDTIAIEQLRQPFDSLMAQLAPKTNIQTSPLLHHFLYPAWFWLKATLAQDGQTIQPTQVSTTEDPYCPPGTLTSSKQLLSLDLESWVPRWYTSLDIELVAEGANDPLLFGPSKVLIKGSRTQCFFKGFGPGFRGTLRELATFRTIISKELPPTIQVCRLHGLVVDTINSSSKPRLVGMLLNYIDPKHVGILGTLKYVAQEVNNRGHIRRWADDLVHIIEALHSLECIWGDAKPENVLVDRDDNVWVIDFGGGYTPGWIDKEHKETKAGDLQSLKKMREWLYTIGS